MIRGAEGRDPGAQGMSGGVGVFRQSSSRVALAGGNKLILRQSQSLTQVWVVPEPADCGHWAEM